MNVSAKLFCGWMFSKHFTCGPSIGLLHWTNLIAFKLSIVVTFLCKNVKWNVDSKFSFERSVVLTLQKQILDDGTKRIVWISDVGRPGNQDTVPCTECYALATLIKRIIQSYSVTGVCCELNAVISEARNYKNKCVSHWLLDNASTVPWREKVADSYRECTQIGFQFLHSHE